MKFAAQKKLIATLRDLRQYSSLKVNTQCYIKGRQRIRK